MGYRCPVCDDPQADGVHLANHLALTAMVRGGDHEAWLDEHIPGWAELGETELAAELTEKAEDADYPQIFEDTTDHSHDHGHGDESHEHKTQREGADRAQKDSLPPGTEIPEATLDEDATEILEEAREMTRKRREEEGDRSEETVEDSETE